MTISPDLVAARRRKLRDALTRAPFDAVLALAAPNVDYATGYRSVGAAVHGIAALAAVVTPARTVLAGPVADSAPAFDAGIDEDDYVAYGRFYFESAGGAARASQLVDRNLDLVAATVAAVHEAGLASATIGIDEAAAPSPFRDALTAGLPAVRWTDASGWISGVRAAKLPGEVELLERAAVAAEDGIAAAVAAARIGTTEQEIARTVARTMVDAGLEPRFVVVTSGERSALADAHANERRLERGDLVRFDVGGILDGYWSDIGRTAVVGAPTPRQQALYDAIVAGEEAELAMARPGVKARDVFDRAIAVVEQHGGPTPYRRQHAGHAIGLTAYEAPIVRPDDEGLFEPGMVFCFETPYYELGWGGMMCEDALVITEDGSRMLTGRLRELTVIDS
jgi:Xaa-Pro aminopeptidase